MTRLARPALPLVLAALFACGEEPAAPAGPAAVSPAAAPAAPLAPAVADGACPCWSEASLAAGFPVAAFWFADLAPANAAGRAALQLVDVANGRVYQALAAYDPEAPARGDNWCQVASFGAGGIERESASAIGIGGAEFAACAGLLDARATALGLPAREF